MLRRTLSTLLFLCCIAAAQAESLDWDWLDEIESLNQSSLAVNFGVDDADGWSRQIDLSLTGPLYTQFNFSYAENYVESDQAQLETDYYALSAATDPLAEVSLSAGFEDWGDDQALTIETLWLGFTFNLGDFSATLMPQQRDIRFQVTEWARRYASHVDVESRDMGLNISYFGLSNWVFTVSYFSYDYSKELSRLNKSYRVIYLFPLETLELASGLDRYRYSIGIGTLYDQINIDLDWSRSRSAIDGNYASQTTVSADIPLNKQFRLNLLGGVQDVDYAEDKILFTNLGLAFYW
jgi:hypothetical protein